MRLFKETDNYEPLVIGSFSFIKVNENDIEPITNSYGMWIEDNNNELFIYDFEYDEDTNSYSIDNQCILQEWRDLLVGYDYDKLNEDQVDAIIKLSNYQIDDSDDANSVFVYDIREMSNVEYEDGVVRYGIDIEESEPIEVGEKYSYYNGSNYEEVILSYEGNDIPFDEITEEYEESFERKEEIYSYHGDTGGTYFYAMEVDEKYVLITQDISYYADSQNNQYIYVDDEEEIALLIAGKVDDDDIETYFPFVKEQYGSNLIKTECDKIISKDDLEKIDEVFDRNRTGGYDVYEHKEFGFIKYIWSCYQGSRSYWEIDNSYEKDED